MDDCSLANRGERSNIPTTTPATNGRIMVVSVVICFVALLIIAFFHMYTRWYLVSRRRSSRLLNNRLRPRIHDVNSSNDATANVDATSSNVGVQGLPPSVLKALPTFLYSTDATRDRADSLECAVCLSEFEDGETGRFLPNCEHWFHADCIDMWFGTHSNCPLCRAPVQNPDGTLVILVQVLQPELTDLSSDYSRLPTVWSSFVRYRKLPELTSVRVETPAEATGVNQHALGSSAPVSSSGSNGQPASK